MSLFSFIHQQLLRLKVKVKLQREIKDIRKRVQRKLQQVKLHTDKMMQRNSKNTSDRVNTKTESMLTFEASLDLDGAVASFGMPVIMFSYPIWVMRRRSIHYTECLTSLLSYTLGECAKMLCCLPFQSFKYALRWLHRHLEQTVPFKYKVFCGKQ